MNEILVRPVLSFQLAFGLDWQPLISGRASSAARRIARQRKASHIVLDGEAPASFGYGVLRARAHAQRRGVHSAAQNLARLHPSGSVGFVLAIGPEHHWLVAVHEGAVMARTDVVHRSAEQALQAMQDLRRLHPRLVILPDEPEGPGLESIARASDAGTLLRDTGRRRRQWLLWLCFVALLCALLAAMHRAWAPRSVRAEPLALGAAEVESRWREAVSAAERRIALHGVAATHEALRHVHRIPALIAGWALTRATCSAQGASWRCGADYERRHRHADNQGLLTAAPQAWRLDFPSIDRATAAWEFTTTTLAGRRHMDTPEHNRRHLQSAWQGVRPAFGRIALGPARPVEIQPPLDGEGRPLQRPSGLPGYASRTVEFEGPLRSLSLLLPHTRSIAWRTVSLTVGAPLQPALGSSRLRATLHGDLYERLEAP